MQYPTEMRKSDLPPVTRMLNYLFLFSLILVLTACKKDEVNKYEGFKPISEESVFDSLQPSKEYDYYEIRDNMCIDSTRYFIYYSKGTKPYADSIYSGNGVYYTNADLCLYQNIVTYDGTNLTFLDSYSQILDFLGPIDCEGDALYLAQLNGYLYNYDDDEFGIKEVKDGFLIRCFKLVSSCSPIEIDQFLIKINKEGDITVLEQSEWYLVEHACV
jgi:hypothetical protein